MKCGCHTSTLLRVTWSYDDATSGTYRKGRLASMSDPTGTTTYTYERRGLLRGETHTIGGVAYTLAFTSDVSEDDQLTAGDQSLSVEGCAA